MSQSPNRLLGIALGVFYLLFGVLGFFFTSSTGFLATAGPKLLGLFGTNPLHNLVHLAVGIALLVGGLSAVRAAKAINTTIGVLFLLVALAGLLIASSQNPLNILALNGADTLLNFASAVVLLVVGIGADPVVPAKKS
jgi:hypothetical protein